MEVFVFDPRTNRESLEEFNSRITDFCAENAVIGIEASVVGSALFLSMTTADDTDAADGTPTVQMVIRPVHTKDTDLEEQLGGILLGIYKRSTEENPCQPIVMKTMSRLDDVTKGWALFTCVNGAAEGSDEGDGHVAESTIPVLDAEIVPP